MIIMLQLNIYLIINFFILILYIMSNFNIEIKAFGMNIKFNIIKAGLLVGLIWLICSVTCINCFKFSIKESMANINYNINNSSHAKKYDKIYIPDGDTKTLAPKTPMPEGQLHMFSNNEFSADCCKSTTYSGTNGCPCLTKEQEEHLQLRGGNRAETEWDQTFGGKETFFGTK